MVPTTQGTLIDMIMQRLGMGQPDGSVPGGPPPAAPDMGPRAVPPMLQFAEDRSQFMPPAQQQPGSLALSPVAMPTQAPPDLMPGAQPKPAALPDLGEAKTPAPMAPMGVPYEPPAPQREAVMTQSADRAPVPTAAPAAPRRAPESGFLSDAAQFVSGMRTGGLFTDLAGGYKAVQGRNATRDFLSEKGLAPETIAAMEADPRIFQPVMADLFSNKTQVINNVLVDSRTGRVIRDFSDTAIKGPQMQTIKLADGSEISAMWDAKQSRWTLPDGRPLPAAVADTAGVPPGADPKTHRETTAREIAKDRVKAQTGLPEALRSSKFIIDKIDDVLGDPDLGRVTGFVGGNTPNLFPGAVNSQAKIDQLKGQAFLQAYQTLKGAGAISDKEGAKAESAQARLAAQKVGTEQYKTALREFRQEVLDLRELAERKARGDYSPLAADAVAAPRAPDPVAETKRAEAGATDIVEGTKIRNKSTGQELTWRGGKWVQ